MRTKPLLFTALAAIFRGVAAASEPSSTAWCFIGCQLAVAGITFGGSPSLLVEGYYAYNCQNELLVHSTYACTKKYCHDEKQWEAGLNYMEKTCEEQSFTLLDGNVDAIANVDLAKVVVVETGDLTQYNSTAIASDDTFTIAYRTIDEWYSQRQYHQWYSKAMYIFWGIVLALGVGANFASWITSRKVSLPNVPEDSSVPRKGPANKIWTAIRTHILLPATFSKSCSQSKLGATLPPRAETLIILSFIIINVVLCAVSYTAFPGNAYYAQTNLQTWRYFADRTGYLSYANLSIFFAFGIRNNILIWLTGWEYPVFNRFHRWVARVSTLEAVLHSIGYTAFSFTFGGYADYSASFKQEYWYTGVIATTAMSLVLVFSIMFLRIRWYDFFLVLHIVLSIVTLVNLFYHTKIFNGEYNGFLWPCVAFWAFDRAVRIARVCFHWAFAATLKAPLEYDTEGNILRIDVTNVFSRIAPQGGAYYFLYSPFTLFGWENHPFTLVRWQESSSPSLPGSPVIDNEKTPDEKVPQNTTIAPISSTPSTRYTFLIRPYKGYTSKLAHKMSKTTNKTFLYEGPYGHTPDLSTYTDILLLIGGSGISVGISAIYTALATNPTARISLVWASRKAALIDSVLARELKCAVETGRVHVNAHITRSSDAHIRAENLTEKIETVRPSVKERIGEAERESAGRLAVVACGPAGMMDDARKAFVEVLPVARGQMELFNEAFFW
ncbi:hypothetical protein EJ05DRAFT_285911 [Pseudovirgaria hyperparasitica]|uniref:FAD-binding FR-type domain-containing protein n=1 Tax=Pseudovirgaria hyperparasitica TaxID=470096 RepID=A0A6A6WE85_9PEZI|nr:uncharacterized protein EJ05DRAFT_285911 [Pseudovirgaria hyperparasitica]KAF2760469.1 hypothetical protein EJ05DRAFT_285911 [Pseudovirgaria hyperparasitica]